jgi:hypothetical protein
MGTWRRVLKMRVCEVSLLSPSVEPAEPLARVALISPASTDRPVADEVIHDYADAQIAAFIEQERHAARGAKDGLLIRPNRGHVIGVR